MERFFENDPEKEHKFFESLNEEELLNELEEEALSFMDQEGVMQVMNIDFANGEFKNHLVSKAVEICEKNFLWKFKNITTKMREIHTVYEWLKLMTEDEDGPIEE